jgi:AraC-like DNA-binding protein
MLKALVPHPEDRAGHMVHSGPALRLLDGYVASLLALDEPPAPELAHSIGVHLLDLVAAAIGPSAEAAEIIAGRGLKAAQLRAALAEIARCFANPRFDVDDIAARLCLSRRSVQRLFEETGKSFTEHVTEHRLERAYAMLSNPQFSRLRIVDIAFAAGFGDVSNFNHLFRRRFGETPTSARATGRATGSAAATVIRSPAQ